MLFRIEVRYTYIGIPAVNDSMMELCPPWDRNQPQAYISPEYLVMRWGERNIVSGLRVDGMDRILTLWRNIICCGSQGAINPRPDALTFAVTSSGITAMNDAWLKSYIKLRKRVFPYIIIESIKKKKGKLTKGTPFSIRVSTTAQIFSGSLDHHTVPNDIYRMDILVSSL